MIVFAASLREANFLIEMRILVRVKSEREGLFGEAVGGATSHETENSDGDDH